ncbi:LLM class flavin-dependent oxidoreductase [Streptomyces sp. NPDC002928]|uniref:LLM class flavin-dependent oxidoreductase n=1 Tax=Streptomyces sp. NPDC002928 TaxID=3154440 RepID=UPI0033B0857F
MATPSTPADRPALSLLDLAPIRKGHTAGDALHRTVELAAHAERLGFHRYWLAEHHNMAPMASSANIILAGVVLGGTRSIRVGTGSLNLLNYAPLVVAEQAGTLDALHPGRFDLGLGRAPGADPSTTAAIRRGRPAQQEYAEQLAELLSYLHGTGRQVRAVPVEDADIPIHLLGSGIYSAALAARLGLPFVFAAHFAPARLQEAMDLYHSAFCPSPALSEPYAMVSVNAVLADDDREAARLFTSVQRRFLSTVRGRMRPLDPPVDDMHGLWTPDEAAAVKEQLGQSYVGTPATVRPQLEALVARTGAREVIFMSETYDQEARLRSYELIASLWSRVTPL